jgi:FlgD Ig-like domain
MIKNVMRLVILVNFMFIFSGFSQTFSWQADTTLKFGSPGTTIIFHTSLINSTANEESLRVIRSGYQLPSGWTSSFCVGSLCYAPFIDTIPDLVHVNASGQAELSIDVQTSANPDQGEVTVRVENWANPSDFITKLFTASTNPNALEEDQLPLAGNFRLYSNYPNPFNPETTIRYVLDNRSLQNIQLIIYNGLGQPIKKLVNTIQIGGEYQVTWDGRNDGGDLVSSGIYFYELRSANKMSIGKMVYIR